MVLEYQTVAVQGRCDGAMNIHAAQGWETFAVTNGGYGGSDRFHNEATTILFMRRERAALPAEPARVRQARPLRPSGKARGRGFSG